MNKTKSFGIHRRLSRQILGVLLSVFLILGMLSSTALPAYAAEPNNPVGTTEELSMDTDAESVVETSEEVSLDDVDLDETTGDVLDSEPEGELELETVAASEYPGDDAESLCAISFESEGFTGVHGNEIGYDYGMGDDFNPEFNDTPYWKNDPDHPGKLVPTTQEAGDYNLYYDTDAKILYLKGLYLSVTGWDGEGPAIYIEDGFGLTIEIEADSTIISTTAQAISAGGGSVTFQGVGNLSLVSKRRGFAALEAWGGVHHAGKGVISLDPAHKAWIGDVTGGGLWAEDALPAPEFGRDMVLDGEPHLGYSGCYLTKDEYEKYAGWNWNGGLVPGDTYFVHGSSMQEVIDKLSGDIPVTFLDGKVSGVDISSDYIFVTSSATDYDYLIQEEQYVTSTRDFEGIIFFGSGETQKTNHPKEDNGIWVDDHVYEFKGEVKELFKTFVNDYGMVLENGFNVDSLNNLEYISLYNDEIYVAYENTEGLSPSKKFAYDLGPLLVKTEQLTPAIVKYNQGSKIVTDGREVYISEWGLNVMDFLDGKLYDDEYYNEYGWDYEANSLAMKNPLPALHINSQCDFIIGGDFHNVSQPKNKDDINIYFGFLPDTNHKVSFIFPFENDGEYYDSFTDEAFGEGGRKHRIYDNYGAIDTDRYIVDYTKEDLTNGTIERGTMTIPIVIVTDDGLGKDEINILMYEHVTEEGSVSGDYSGAVTMDMTSIPDGKIMGNIDITADQLDVLEAGNAVDIDLAVNELDANAAVNKEAVTDIAGVVTSDGYADPFYIDLYLSASIRDVENRKLEFADGTSEIALTELDEPVELTIAIPEKMQSTNKDREYAIVRRHEIPGKPAQTEVLPVKYDANTKSLTFDTDKFSTYAIVYKDMGTPEKPVETGKFSAEGIYFLSQTRDGIFAGMVTSDISEADKANLEYSWYVSDGGDFVMIQDWTKGNEWITYKPEKGGDYVIVCWARLVEDDVIYMEQATSYFPYHPEFKGYYQGPNPNGEGYLIGLESYENHGYQYEMLILDCTLYAEEKDAWIYSTGKCYVPEGNAFWTIWQPEVGYYWTLFRIYDSDGVTLLDEVCYGFANI